MTNQESIRDFLAKTIVFGWFAFIAAITGGYLAGLPSMPDTVFNLIWTGLVGATGFVFGYYFAASKSSSLPATLPVQPQP